MIQQRTCRQDTRECSCAPRRVVVCGVVMPVTFSRGGPRPPCDSSTRTHGTERRALAAAARAGVMVFVLHLHVVACAGWLSCEAVREAPAVSRNVPGLSLPVSSPRGLACPNARPRTTRWTLYALRGGYTVASTSNVTAMDAPLDSPAEQPTRLPDSGGPHAANGVKYVNWTALHETYDDWGDSTESLDDWMVPDDATGLACDEWP
ncbi:MAG: hypothetical protein ACPIOQ_79565, partial [Promethearchaeia archaeon]